MRDETRRQMDEAYARAKAAIAERQRNGTSTNAQAIATALVRFVGATPADIGTAHALRFAAEVAYARDHIERNGVARPAHLRALRHYKAAYCRRAKDGLHNPCLEDAMEAAICEIEAAG